jgi:dihydroflavonol-4-reductase
MKVAVTGATGFLGAAVVRALLAANHQVIAMVRGKTNPKLLEGLDVERRVGDISDVASLEPFLDGAEVLCHVAGSAGRFYDDVDEYIKANVIGTRNVFRAARNQKIKRAIYTGSIAIPARVPSEYARTKRDGAYEARMIASTAFDVIVVHPSGMIGARDVRPTPLGQSVLDFAQGKLWAVLGGGSGYIDVDDAARGHVAAIERGDATREYVLTAEYWRTIDLFLALAERLQVKKPIEIPAALCLAIARISEPIARLRNSEPIITTFSAEYLSVPQSQVPDGVEDRDALGLTYRPVLDSFMEAVEWFKAEGYMNVGR